MAKKKEQIIRLSQTIELRYKCVRTFWGKRKIVPTSISEQRKFKKTILKFFPDNMFYDDLNDDNSIEAGDQVFSCSMLDQPIDIRYRSKKTFWGKRRIIEATITEQQKIKKVLLKLHLNVALKHLKFMNAVSKNTLVLQLRNIVRGVVRQLLHFIFPNRFIMKG